MTTIYHYDEVGFFTQESIADKCQLTGNNLIPAWSTTLEPPAVELPSRAIFDGVKWLVFTPVVTPQQQPTTDQIRAAIDNFIVAQILEKYDYASLASLSGAVLMETYKVQALRIWDWIHRVWIMSDDIKSGAKVYSSIADAIADLPILEDGLR